MAAWKWNLLDGQKKKGMVMAFWLHNRGGPVVLVADDGSEVLGRGGETIDDIEIR